MDKAIQLHEYILSKDELPEYHYFQTLFELGENYFSAGIYNKAEEIFLKLKEYDTHKEDALNKLIIINEYFGEWQKALNFLEELDKESNLDLGHLPKQVVILGWTKFSCVASMKNLQIASNLRIKNW